MKPPVLNRKTKKGTLEIIHIHQWLIYHLGKANKCENKSCKKIGKRFEYALIDGKPYDRKRENYMMLCSQCHRKYDWDSGKFESQKKILGESGRKYGKENGKAVCLLTQNQAEEIRNLYKTGKYRKTTLAKMFGNIDPSIISNITLNKNYV